MTTYMDAKFAIGFSLAAIAVTAALVVPSTISEIDNKQFEEYTDFKNALVHQTESNPTFESFGSGENQLDIIFLLDQNFKFNCGEWYQKDDHYISEKNCQLTLLGDGQKYEGSFAYKSNKNPYATFSYDGQFSSHLNDEN